MQFIFGKKKNWLTHALTNEVGLTNEVYCECYISSESDFLEIKISVFKIMYIIIYIRTYQYSW